MDRFDGTVGPKVGISSHSTDRSMPLLELAHAVEARGFTGLFLSEHPHLPVDQRRSPFPPSRGIPGSRKVGPEIPDLYAHFWCPYAGLAFVAAQTRLEVGPMVSLIAEHDAITLAKTIATIDVLSEGRFILGVGWGWHREQFEDHGFPANVRAQVLEEKLLLMKSLWTQDIASFEGEFVRMSPSRAWPKPVSKPHTTVFAGLPANPRNYRRMARWADGWIPIGSALDPKFGFGDCLAELHRALEEAGRDPATFRLMSTHSDLSPDSMRVAFDRAAEFGFERITLKVEESSTDDTLRRLDLAAAAVHAILG